MQITIFNKAPRLLCWLLPATLCCSPLFADTTNLTHKPAWDFGIQALYLKPSFTSGFAYLEDTRVAPNTDRRNPLKQNWGWGFKVEGSYHFCPDSDVDLNWYHYKNSSGGTFVYQTNPTADHYTFTPEWNAVNLEFGQAIHFNQIKNLRLHGGLQYAQLKTTYHAEGTDPIKGHGTKLETMQYNGVGPRIGMDLSVGLIKNVDLSAYFGGDIAILVGHSNFHFNETFFPYTTSGSRPTVVVPEMGLKIGAKYDYAMCGGHLLFDVGYLLVNYFNALDLRSDFVASESNFALNGLYAGIKWGVG